MLFETSASTSKAELTPFVRSYTKVVVDVASDVLVKTTPARPDVFLQVIVEGNHLIRNLRTNEATLAPRVTLVGPSSIPHIQIEVQGRLKLLVIQFQPTALHALAGMDMTTLLNRFVCAEALFPVAITELAGHLEKAIDGENWFLLTDSTMEEVFKSANPIDSVGRVAQWMRDCREDMTVSNLADKAGLSARQFQRHFIKQVGTTPKIYARLCRISHVFNDHQADPRRSWAAIAADHGFFDQAHLAREFKALTLHSPGKFAGFRLSETKGKHG